MVTILDKDIIYKSTKNNGNLYIKEVSVDLAKEMCIKNHYSRKWNTIFGKLNIGIFQDDNPECLGVAVFGHLMNPSSYKTIANDIERDSILELNRLWLDDVLGHNAETTFLAMCFKHIKKYYPEVELIQSFADGRLGCGTIYKASNFKYYGYSETLFFEDVSDTTVSYHKMAFERADRLGNMAHLNYLLADGKLRAFRTKTYRYIYHLKTKVKNKIKLKEVSYPVYDIGKDYDDNYKQTLAVMARCYIAFHWAGDSYDNEKQVINKYIESNYGKYSVDSLFSIAMNKSKYMEKYAKDTKGTGEKIRNTLYRKSD